MKMINRLRWLLFWRTLYIAPQIAWQVAADIALYGHGAAQRTTDGKIERIDPKALFVRK